MTTDHLMTTGEAPAFWLTEEKLDKTRRRRSCLGCGEAQEYLTKETAPSYVAWFKAHQACRPDKSFAAEMPHITQDRTQEIVTAPPPYTVGMRIEACSTACSGWTTGQVVKLRRDGSLGNVQVHLDGYKNPCYPFDIRPVAVQSSEENALPECPQGGCVGAFLTASGLCTDCRQIKEDGPVDDPRIAPFCERLKISRAEFDEMVEAGTIDVRQFYTTELPREADPAESTHETGHTREALLDRSPANPGHRSHAGPPLPVSEALMTKIKQGYSGQSIADKSQVRKPFTYEGRLYAHTGHDHHVTDSLRAYLLVPRDQWPGDTLEYSDLNPETGYHGIEVKYGKTAYVMQGPEVTFVCEETE